MRPVPTSIAAKVARAAELFAERGVEQTKIDDIAEVTGVPKTTLYYYFVGKDEILVFLQRDLIVEVADAVSIAVESDGTAADRLREVVRAQLRVMAERPAVWRAFVANLGRAIQLPELVEVLDTAYYAPVRELLHQGVADGSLRPMDDATTVAMAVFGAATLAGLRHVLAGEPLDVDRIADHVSAIVIGGMGAS
jgi:AcrR family transcriptional regulator